MSDQDIEHSVEGRDFEFENNFYEENHKIFVDGYLKEMDRLEKDDRFKHDDTYHNVKSSHHTVYKLITDKQKGGTRIINKEGTRGYEFLIEFDKEKPSYGIYYGCRGLILGGVQAEEIMNFKHEWEQILRPKVCEVLNNTFPQKNFNRLCLVTDNANNKTYWPFWIRLSEDEDISETAGLATCLIYNVYKLYLENPNSPILKANDKYSPFPSPLDTHYTIKAYNELFKDLKETKKRINLIIRESLKNRLIEKNNLYEKAWNYKRFNSNHEFSFFLYKLYQDYIKPNNKELDDTKIWSLFTPLFLSKTGKPLPNLRREYRDYGFKEGREEVILQYIKDLKLDV